MKYKFNNKEYEVKSVLDRFQQDLKIDLLKEKVIDNLVVEDSGMTVYTKTRNKKLSKGCRACKTGTWWCIFVGNNCNSNCSFCSQIKIQNLLI